MAQIETWLECDLRKTVEVVPLKGHLYSDDSKGNKLGVILTNRGVPYLATGTLFVYGIRHDGVTVLNSRACSNTDRPYVELTDDFYNVVGPIQLVLRLVEGEGANQTQTVVGACTTYVFKTTSDRLIDSGSVVPDIETLIAQLDACERAASAADTAARNAQAQVDAAAESASDAASSARQARQDAMGAAASAGQAQQDARNAALAAGSANDAASQARSQAQYANNQAALAQEAAAQARQEAIAAETSATNAANSAAASAESASTAQSQVATAQQAASASAQSASDAAASATTASGNAATAIEAADAANRLNQQLSNQFSQLLPNLVTGGEVRGNALYLLHNDEVVAGPFSGFGGGGGGGGGGTATVSFTFSSVSGDTAFTVAKGDNFILDLTWSSTEGDPPEPTGNGRLVLAIDGVQKYSKNVAQGVLHEDVTNYLKDGDNTLQFTLTDAYGNRRVRSFSVSVMDLTIRSTFDDSIIRTDSFLYYYTPYGDLDKTMHFIIDPGSQDSQEYTDLVTGYGREKSKTIPAQTHGAHKLLVYYTGTLNGESVESNRLIYDIICIEDGNDMPIIASNYSVSEVDQYTTVAIPYMVYTPGSQLSEMDVYVNGTQVTHLENIPRTKTSFSYRLDTPNEDNEYTTITFVSGATTKIFLIHVNAISAAIEAETEGLSLYLSSSGRSNNEANPATWISDQNGTQVACQFSGFNWVSDGWQLDDDGATVMRVTGDARITIPFKPFATNKINTGFTFEIDFETRDVRNYDAPILSCLYNGYGILLTSQRMSMTSQGSSINMQFKEEEHVRASFVVQKASGGIRPVFCYINGVLSAVAEYASDDNFRQTVPQDISIGSSDSTLDIYTIRVYETDLPMKQMEANWIADTQNSELMLTRYGRNNVRDPYTDEVLISKLPGDLPYMIITCPELPQYKGDKKICTGSYTDPLHSDKDFTFENCQIDVQGTSSQYYARKNYKMKFNGGFTNSNGETASKYKMRADSIAVKTFCMKADVASSEGANNVELVRLYEEACPYKTPAQVANNKVRQGIDGFPIVIFWNNPDTAKVTFLGKYNFNNDKSTEDVFGFVEGDESWETRLNNTDMTNFKSNDFTSTALNDDGETVPAWTLAYEPRYPDTDPPYSNYLQLREFITWVMTTDPDTATGDALSQTADFGETVTEEVNGQIVTTPVTYSVDNAAYRRAKFKAELGNYVELDSALFYYLFTELFLMADSREKNSFPSFMGAAIGGAATPNE
jgi:hypothetical protein